MASINEKMAGVSWRGMSTGDASDAAELERRIQEAYKNHLAGPFSAGHTHSVNAQSLNPLAVTHERKNMIAMRLRGPVPFKNFETFLEDDKVYAAIVTAQGAVFLEDEAALFPSDTFMAQLRLLLP